MAEALKMIKKEFGSEAVILSAKTIKKTTGLLGSLRKSGVEITAASDGQRPSEASEEATLQKTQTILPSPANSRFKDLIGTTLDKISLGKSLPANNQNQSFSIAWGNRPSGADDPEIVALRLALDNHGVNSSLGDEISEAVLRSIPQRKELTRQRIKKEFIQILGKKISIASPIARSVGQPRKIAFVGPTGAGKSTTIAKLAAIYALQKNYPVGIITLDQDRVGSTVALEKYSRIIGVPFAVACHADHLINAVRDFHNMAFIFIDTPGLGASQKQKISQLSILLRRVALDEVHLLMSATTKEKDMRGLCEAFKTCQINRLIITKLDETADVGNLINLLHQTDIPLAYLTGDQHIPGDIQAARFSSLADLVLKSTDADLAKEEDNQKTSSKTAATIDTQLLNDDYYIANKNSDIFHHCSCKSVKRIASDNVQVFRSLSEAEEKNFKPCRMCCPETLTKNSLFRKFTPQTAVSR
jgi:flagellar biosynthesis protein FlhF